MKTSSVYTAYAMKCRRQSQENIDNCIPVLDVQNHVRRNLTSLAEENWRRLKSALKSGVLVSRSWRAPATLVSSSDGFEREGLFATILLRALMVAEFVVNCRDGNGFRETRDTRARTFGDCAGSKNKRTH
jgi:hypothetical protein